jgi:hypothetical protein
MSNQPWWEPIGQLLTFAILMSLFMGWMVLSRDRGRSAPGQLIQPVSTLMVGIAGLVFGAGCAIFSNVFSNDTVTLWTTSLFVTFALLSCWIISFYFLDRHRVDIGGLTFTTLAGSKKFIAWPDVTNVRYSPSFKWFRIESQTGAVARLSAMLIGLPYFAKAALEHAPAAAIDADTNAVLRATAEGNPPSPWN